MAESLIIIPTYNERENIGILIPILRQKFPTFDVLVIDDHSPDGTWQLVKMFSRDDTGVNLLLRNTRQGLGRALFAGYKYAVENNYAKVIQMDADFSHPPEYISDIVRNLDRNNIVICSRYLNVESAGMEDKRVVSKLANWIARTLFFNTVKDPSSGFRGYPVSFLRKVVNYRPLSRGYFIQVEMVMLAFKFGYGVKEIPFIYRKRKQGKSKLNIWEGISSLPAMLTLVIRRYC